MAVVEFCRKQNEIIWCDPAILPECDSCFFTPAYWQNQHAITGSAAGRGTTLFINHNQRDLVLRHYRRGGMIGKLISDSYVFWGIEKSRVWQELNLLSKLGQLHLPAPKPVAGRLVRNGLIYHADIISEKIPQAKDTHTLLQQQPLTDEIWHSIGLTIRQFHNAQVYHHDLNIHNIMIDQHQQVWLIDFDKCGFRNGNNWKQANLERLLRSLRKEQLKQHTYYFDEKNWAQLIKGYQT